MHKLMTGEKTRFSPGLMDYLAIVAGVINVIVIGYIVGYWLMQ
jgi:hypothetical protein